MKLLQFELMTKENTTDYTTVENYLDQLGKSIITSASKIIEEDFIAELYVAYEQDDLEIGHIAIASHDVKNLMDWLKGNVPAVYAIIPPFDVEQFEKLAHEMKSSSHLSFRTFDPTDDLKFEFGDMDDLEPDDFVPECKTVQESIDAIKAAGHYCEIHCYPRTPVAFWNFYGIDFQSILDHATKD
ncbi:hypothetical protein F9Z84_07295 [Escherichia coli]|nr:hypothetical protein F9Z84_07295 [Escherichia coli]